MKNNIGLLLSKRAIINPEREAYVDSSSGLRLTFNELNERTNRLANSLLKLGVSPGARAWRSDRRFLSRSHHPRVLSGEGGYQWKHHHGG